MGRGVKRVVKGSSKSRVKTLTNAPKEANKEETNKGTNALVQQQYAHVQQQYAQQAGLQSEKELKNRLNNQPNEYPPLVLPNQLMPFLCSQRTLGTLGVRLLPR